MKILMIIFTLLFFAPVVEAQDAGFFIPQQAIDMMNRSERLPPLRTRQPVATQSQTAQPNRTPATSASANTPPNMRKIVTPTPMPHETLADDNSRRKAAPQPRPAQEPMIPQTGTPVIPVTADDVPTDIAPDGNTKTTPPQTEPEPTDDGKYELTYDRIINEYQRDIKKISQNLPAENKRLNEMLKNYKDEVLIYN